MILRQNHVQKRLQKNYFQTQISSALVQVDQSLNGNFNRICVKEAKSGVGVIGYDSAKWCECTYP